MVLKIKLKLSRHEVFSIAWITREAARLAISAEMNNDTIMLAEQSESWAKKLVSADARKPKTYSMALSLARILHLELQQIPMSDANQSLLVKLDQELTNIGMKPLFPIKLP